MRKPIIAGNWKMHKTRDEALQFIYAVNMKLPSIKEVDAVICAQAPILRDLVKRQNDNLRIGAQNMHYEETGAFTGEVSGKLLRELNVRYVIIGHSERRAYYNETDEDVNKKIKTAFRYNIKPIVCVGESLEIRESNQTEEFIGKQIEKAFDGITIDQLRETVIAYEPIWAIGTGRTATPEMANETCGFIRSKIASMYNPHVANQVRIQYGGSVKVNNIDALMAQEHIDGALIGGASLNPEDFLYFVRAALD